ncbi:MAG TPA: hypothetical protein VLH35_01560 [Candidatus Acidoferrales bacterium]|nr:hypothetical protein [Candidatus Acidoferrales bacterium]
MQNASFNKSAIAAKPERKKRRITLITTSQQRTVNAGTQTDAAA